MTHLAALVLAALFLVTAPALAAAQAPEAEVLEEAEPPAPAWLAAVEGGAPTVASEAAPFSFGEPEVSTAAPRLLPEAPWHDKVEARGARRSVAPRILPPALGGGVLALSWLTTFVGTMGWYFDTTSCRGAQIGLFSDPDGPYHCDHAGPNDDALGASFIPVVGPWIMLNTPNVDPAFPVTMGIFQAAGLLTLAIGTPLGILHADASEAEARVELSVRGSAGGGQLVVDGTF